MLATLELLRTYDCFSVVESFELHARAIFELVLYAASIPSMHLLEHCIAF